MQTMMGHTSALLNQMLSSFGRSTAGIFGAAAGRGREEGERGMCVRERGEGARRKCGTAGEAAVGRVQAVV
jgi:hypothetical protein